MRSVHCSTMGRATVVPLLLVAAFCVAGASRLGWSSFDEVSDILNLRGGDSQGRQKAAVLFKHFVEPSEADDFIDNWNQNIGGPGSKANGNLQIHLSRPYTTNAFIMGYSEWESWDDLAKFVRSDEANKFWEYVDQQNIRWELSLLEDRSEETPSRRQVKSHTRKEDKFSVLAVVDLRPQHREDFVDVWRETASNVAKENGNIDYRLSRCKQHNYKFYVYGAWESEDAWEEHRKQDYIRKLKDWAEEKDVIFYESPLHHLDNY